MTAPPEPGARRKITRQVLIDEHPALYAALRASGHAEGTMSERLRVLRIQAAASPALQELAWTMINADTPTDTAVAILHAANRAEAIGAGMEVRRLARAAIHAVAKGMCLDAAYAALFGVSPG